MQILAQSNIFVNLPSNSAYAIGQQGKKVLVTRGEADFPLAECQTAEMANAIVVELSIEANNGSRVINIPKIIRRIESREQENANVD